MRSLTPAPPVPGSFSLTGKLSKPNLVTRWHWASRALSLLLTTSKGRLDCLTSQMETPAGREITRISILGPKFWSETFTYIWSFPSYTPTLNFLFVMFDSSLPSSRLLAPVSIIKSHTNFPFYSVAIYSVKINYLLIWCHIFCKDLMPRGDRTCFLLNWIICITITSLSIGLDYHIRFYQNRSHFTNN